MSVLNINDRLAICKKCPIFNPSTKRCNSSLWLNPMKFLLIQNQDL